MNRGKSGTLLWRFVQGRLRGAVMDTRPWSGEWEFAETATYSSEAKVLKHPAKLDPKLRKFPGEDALRA